VVGGGWGGGGARGGGREGERESERERERETDSHQVNQSLSLCILLGMVNRDGTGDGMVG